MAYMITLVVAAVIMMSKPIGGCPRRNLGPENNLGLDVWFNYTGVPFFRCLGSGKSATACCFHTTNQPRIFRPGL